jgi:hypothetical protein
MGRNAQFFQNKYCSLQNIMLYDNVMEVEESESLLVSDESVFAFLDFLLELSAVIKINNCEA